MTKILVVDNYSETSEKLCEVLQQESFQVLVASSGSVAVSLLEQELPDLILCNVDVFPVEGLDFLCVVRERPETLMTPFIFLSSKISESNRRTGMNLGADDYVALPFDPQRLIETVNYRLSRHQVFEQQSSWRLEELRRNLTVALPHELRTPLQGIITSSELLSEYWQTLEQDEIIEITQNISLSADRLNRLIQKFLVYFKLDLVVSDPQEREGWHFGSVSTSPVLIRSIGNKVARRYERVNDLFCGLCEATIAISEKWFMLLMEEVIDNAFKFSQPAMVKNMTGTAVHITTSIEGDRWVCRIQDQGRGLSEEDIAHIGAYMQFDRLQYEQQGTGLGLAIAERIVKIYNGTMTIDSTVNEGTLLTISLPMQDAIEVEDNFLIG
ncbi:hybrid sensor histidine kinase/response regulator [[Limnothrix rosea] IAM M-220]|uniref:hybrid sensor histidine kinase/response regulator n=1 Tax=[Limnothrix rosea] IAM M-220 TaxID=454133 RepID=UPI00095ED17A|nr:hybrid sensor histidine kinase/response regulator [[Limnothrix rosea] IAM M-220]OKH13820.1 hypothetical protein NIES208_14650 [[Limnothrix rosea] IAM M-220]